MISSRLRASPLVAPALAAGLVVGLAVGLGAAVSPLALVLAAAAVLALLCIAYPFFAGVLLLVLAFGLSFVASAVALPAGVKLLPDLVSACLVAAMLVSVVGRTERTHWPSGSLWVAALALSLLVSVVIGGSDEGVALLSVRSMVRFMPLMFAPAILGWSEVRRRRMIWLIVGLCLVQTPVAAIQRAAYAGASGDPMGGTLGPSTQGF